MWPMVQMVLNLGLSNSMSSQTVSCIIYGHQQALRVNCTILHAAT